jgi:hypothetical protein
MAQWPESIHDSCWSSRCCCSPAPATSVVPSPSAAVPSVTASSPAPSQPADPPDEDPATGTPIEPGEVSDEAQSHLDEALGLELGALEGASAGVAGPRRKVLDRLPENPKQVLAALKDYVWFSPEARAAYDRAVKAG